MAPFSLLAATCNLMLLILPAMAMSGGRTGHGLIGYGIVMYYPPCAQACRDTATSWMLDCPEDPMDSMHMSGMDMGMGTPSPTCLANNDPFLQTIAWCISTHCKEFDIGTLERWWQSSITGREDNQPNPKQSYQESLAKVTTPPEAVVATDAILNVTSLVDEDSYIATYNGETNFEAMEIHHATYG